MAGQKVKVPVGPNQVADGLRVDFKPTAEPWCEFECEDGTRLRVKLVVSEVIRLDEVRSPLGEPTYLIRSQNVVQAAIPDDLRKGGPAGEGGGGAGSGGQYL